MNKEEFDYLINPLGKFKPLTNKEARRLMKLMGKRAGKIKDDITIKILNANN